jgi:ribonuclease R
VAPGEPEVVEQLRRLARVAQALKDRRFAEGSIDFDLPTAEIVLGDSGHPVDIVEAPRTLAHRAIEEAMLAANRAVAEALLEARIPLLHRVHEPPSPEDLAELEDLLGAFGLLERSRAAPLDARQIARAVGRAVGRPEERLVNLVTLRSMRQAHYSDADRGHFALAFPHYAHFTSPIRRYADLVVHRALLDHLEGGRQARERALARGEGLARVASRISTRERVAMEAERDMVAIKKCVFTARHVGAEFDGTIESVAPHGLYVTLEPFFVEGLVHVRRLPRGALFDARNHAFAARRGGARWRLGDRVRVHVDSVDAARGWISFSLAGVEGKADAGPRPSRRRRRDGSNAS